MKFFYLKTLGIDSLFELQEILRKKISNGLWNNKFESRKVTIQHCYWVFINDVHLMFGLDKTTTQDWDSNFQPVIRCEVSSLWRKISGTGELQPALMKYLSWCFKCFIWLRCFHSTWSSFSFHFSTSGLFFELSTLFQVVSFFWKIPTFPFASTKTKL